MRSNLKTISPPFPRSKKIPRKKKKALKAPFIGSPYPLTIIHGVYRRCKTKNKLLKRMWYYPMTYDFKIIRRGNQIWKKYTYDRTYILLSIGKKIIWMRSGPELEVISHVIDESWVRRNKKWIWQTFIFWSSLVFCSH